MTGSDDIKKFLPLISRPSRYIGCEINSVKKNLPDVKLKVALAFPDIYEVGMSHLGIQILYQTLNSRNDIACERVFSPWLDMERLLRDKRLPLATLESGIPLNQLDILGFSIQYELSYTNILNILNLGNIPLYSKDRNGAHPLIIGGGPIAFNPEPIADFFDIFVLGDGEEVLLEIADAVIEWKNTRGGRQELLKVLSRMEGIYVPSLFDVTYNSDGTVREISPLMESYTGVNKRIVAELNALSLPAKPVVPFTKTIHDHLTVEINRGCTRGCRFCQAGMIYRPNRERSPENIAKLIDSALKNTGYDEVSFLSLSAGDYSCLGDLLINFMERFADKKIAVALPSLRVGTLTPRLIEEIQRVRKTGFTMAPEAGSERLRQVLNKGIEEDSLIESSRSAFAMGWRSMKLYYMIGLPTETLDDIRGIVELSDRVQQSGRRPGFRPTVNVSISQFVPKPHTPFQWEPQIKIEESLEKQAFLRRELKHKRLGFKWHDARMSFLEGVFSRGDRRLSAAIENAFEQGMRFDSWGEQFRFDAWQEIFRNTGINPEFYTYRKRRHGELFPWGHLNARVDAQFLYAEYKKSIEAEETPDCKTERCGDCGVCDHTSVKNVAFYNTKRRDGTERRTLLPSASLQPIKIRLIFSKTDIMKYLGHLELVTVFSRAIRRAGIPIAYSSGFHPLPKIAFSQPLPVGIESISEESDLELTERMEPGEVLKRLNGSLPAGIKILDASILQKPAPLHTAPQKEVYLVFLEERRLLSSNGRNLNTLINEVLQADEIIIRKERDGKGKDINVRPLIKKLSFVEKDTLQMAIEQGMAGSIRPYEIIAHLLNIPRSESRLIPILKI